MRYELRRKLETITRTLAVLGERDNARALALRLHDGTAEAWLRGAYGEHVWIEVGASLRALRREAACLPLERRAAALAGERAYGEADALLAERPALRVIAGGAAQTPRAA